MPIPRLALFALILPAAVGAGTADAQVAAVQGASTISAAQGTQAPTPAAAQASATAFHSPMMLTLPFPLADRNQWGTGKWSEPGVLDPIADYRCDGVALRDVSMRGAIDKGGSLSVDVKGKLDNVPGHDKRVDLKIELLNGDAVGATGYAYRLKAPESKTHGFKFALSFPAAVIQSDPATRMRITLTDYDD